jgi:hypothetical protein
VAFKAAALWRSWCSAFALLHRGPQAPQALAGRRMIGPSEFHAGLKRAVDAGKRLGRPRIDLALEKRIKGRLRADKAILKVAAECGVGSGTVKRIKREMVGKRRLESVAA